MYATGWDASTSDNDRSSDTSFLSCPQRTSSAVFGLLLFKFSRITIMAVPAPSPNQSTPAAIATATPVPQTAKEAAASTSSPSASGYLVSSYFISGAVAGAASRTSVAPLERVSVSKHFTQFQASLFARLRYSTEMLMR